MRRLTIEELATNRSAECRRPHIPYSHPVEQAAKHNAGRKSRHRCLRKILVALVPRIANGGVNVGDVLLVRMRDDPLGKGSRRRNHQIILGQVECLHGLGTERKCPAIVSFDQRHAVQPARVNSLCSDRRAIVIVQEIIERVEVR